MVYASRPRVVVHETAGRATRGARRRRPGALRRPLVRGARARRPLLQPQLHPRPRRVRGRLMVSARSSRTRRQPMRLVIVYFGPLNINSAIQAFHFGNDLTDGRLARDAGRRRRRPARRSGRSASRASSASPTTTCRSCSSSLPARARAARSCSPGPRARTCAMATEDFVRRLGVAVRRPPRGQRVAPLRSRRRPLVRRGRAGSRSPSRTGSAPPTLIHPTRSERFMSARRRDHGDHRGAQRVQPRRPPAPRRPARDRLRRASARTRAAARGARPSASRRTSS